jgi:hypothetical protein
MKKLIAALTTIVLTMSTIAFAFDFVDHHHPKMQKPLPKTKQIAQRPVRPAPEPKELEKNIKNAAMSSLSWLNYLRFLGDALAKYSTYDFKGNANDYLSEIKLEDIEDQEMLFAVKDYKAVSSYFYKSFHKSPQEGTLEEYRSFYKEFYNLSPREHVILPTLAIWKTGSVEAIIPFRHQYWYTPQLAALAYDTMAKVDYEKAHQFLQHYIKKLSAGIDNTEIKQFFDVWRSNADKTLPSVKDADEFEELALK